MLAMAAEKLPSAAKINGIFAILINALAAPAILFSGHLF